MDVLAVLEELENQNRKPTNTKFVDPLKGRNNNNNNTRRSRSQGPSRPGSRAQTRPQSRPTSRQSNAGTNSRPQSSSGHFAPSVTNKSSSPERSGSRSPSVASTRRISFAEPPPPPSTRRRLRVVTRKDNLFSGFGFDSAVFTKYNVSENEWTDFSDGLINAAALPKRAKHLWPLYKTDIAKKIKRDLGYEQSDVKRYLNAWNRNYKRKGFTVQFEVPGPVRISDTATPEDKELAKKEAKFFRMCITPAAEKGTSIYSRASSLTRSVRGEGAVAASGREEAERIEKELEGSEGDEQDDMDDEDEPEVHEVADKMENLKINQVEATDQLSGQNGAVA